MHCTERDCIVLQHSTRTTYLWALSQGVEHGLAGEEEGALVVHQRVALPLRAAPLPLVPCLVEVRLWHQHQALHRHQHLPPHTTRTPSQSTQSRNFSCPLVRESPCKAPGVYPGELNQSRLGKKERALARGCCDSGNGSGMNNGRMAAGGEQRAPHLEDGGGRRPHYYPPGAVITTMLSIFLQKKKKNPRSSAPGGWSRTPHHYYPPDGVLTSWPSFFSEKTKETRGAAHLEDGGGPRVPDLGVLPSPRVEQREAELPILVQVGVHAQAAAVVVEYLRVPGGMRHNTGGVLFKVCLEEHSQKSILSNVSSVQYPEELS